MEVIKINPSMLGGVVTTFGGRRYRATDVVALYNQLSLVTYDWTACGIRVRAREAFCGRDGVDGFYFPNLQTAILVATRASKIIGWPEELPRTPANKRKIEMLGGTMFKELRGRKLYGVIGVSSFRLARVIALFPRYRKEQVTSANCVDPPLVALDLLSKFWADPTDAKATLVLLSC